MTPARGPPSWSASGALVSGETAAMGVCFFLASSTGAGGEPSTGRVAPMSRRGLCPAGSWGELWCASTPAATQGLSSLSRILFSLSVSHSEFTLLPPCCAHGSGDTPSTSQSETSCCRGRCAQAPCVLSVLGTAQLLGACGPLPMPSASGGPASGGLCSSLFGAIDCIVTLFSLKLY